MPRDATESRRRILDAAVGEFAAHGIAGARVDRIAATSGLNKALIYSYIGPKSALFDAAFAHAVARVVEESDFDATRLDDYVVRLYDRYAAHPEVVRLALWDRLERGGDGVQSGAVAAVEEEKVERVREAQRRGALPAAPDADHLVALVTILGAMWHLIGDPSPDDSERARQRTTLRRLVARLMAPS